MNPNRLDHSSLGILAPGIARFSYKLLRGLVSGRIGSYSVQVIQGRKIFAWGQSIHLTHVYFMRKRCLRTIKAFTRNGNKRPQRVLHFFQQILRKFTPHGKNARQGGINLECICSVVDVDLLKPPINRIDDCSFIASSLSQFFVKAVIQPVNRRLFGSTAYGLYFSAGHLVKTEFCQFLKSRQGVVGKLPASGFVYRTEAFINMAEGGVINGNRRIRRIAESWFALYCRRAGMRKTHDVERDRFATIFYAVFQNIQKLPDLFSKNG